MPYARIGEILGITENAVQVRIFRARKMLRKKLGLPEGAVSLKLLARGPPWSAATNSSGA